MFTSALTAGGIIFVVLAGWVAVDRWFKRDQQRNPDTCAVDRHECGHCLMMDACVHRDDTE